MKKQSVPVVPWNAEQSSILLYEPFILLCHQLGLHLPADTGKLFVRVPEFWTADHLFNVAQRLGPIDKGKSINEFAFFHKFNLSSVFRHTKIRCERIENKTNSICKANLNKSR